MTTLWRCSTEGAEFWVRSGGDFQYSPFEFPAKTGFEPPGAELALTTILVTFSGVDERGGVREMDFRRSGLAVGADLGAMAANQGKGG